MYLCMYIHIYTYIHRAERFEVATPQLVNPLRSRTRATMGLLNRKQSSLESNDAFFIIFLYYPTKCRRKKERLAIEESPEQKENPRKYRHDYSRGAHRSNSSGLTQQKLCVVVHIVSRLHFFLPNIFILVFIIISSRNQCSFGLILWIQICKRIICMYA